MDVDKTSFYPRLLDILANIAESEFVAFDLELSGVPSKPISQESGKASLQTRYTETKEAAERYSILQIGLTLVVRNTENAGYILRPYNFDLNPLIVERGLEIERIISFQSGAAEFLLKTGFDLGRPFHSGVPYLSHTESKVARDIHAKRHDRSAMADIAIKATEIESLAFMARVRQEINAWMDKRYAPDLIIGPIGMDLANEEAELQDLSRFEKRLVHQLVRAEYPDLISIPRRGLVRIARFNKEREDRIQATRKRELEERIRRQKGFRWVIDALLGGDFSDIDLSECLKDPGSDAPSLLNIDDCRSVLARAQSHLRQNPRVMIGHNCFLDLVYIYRTFIGQLPETVDEFQRKLHKRWPMIVDTKYMSTEDCPEIDPGSSLEQVAAQLSREQNEPSMHVPSPHERYAMQSRLHEAGYDSYMTAQVALLLTSKLSKQHSSNTNQNDQLSKQHDDGGSSGILLTASTPPPTTSLHGSADRFIPSSYTEGWQGKGDPTVTTTIGVDDPFVYRPHVKYHKYVPVVDQTPPFSGAMPHFDASFWHIYGNKLRVYGTEEAVCVLSNEVKTNSTPMDDSGDGGVRLS